MSMNGNYRAISGSLCGAIERDESLAEAAVWASGESLGNTSLPPALEGMLAGFPPEQRALFMGDPRFQAMMSATSANLSDSTGDANEALTNAGFGPADLRTPLDIGKAWHGIHFLLAGTKSEPTAPPGDAVLGGVNVGDDVGYGPARLLTPPGVQRTAAALAQIDDEELRRRFAPESMAAADIYGGNWEDPDEFLWLTDEYHRLVAYYQTAAERGDGLLLWIA